MQFSKEEGARPETEAPTTQPIAAGVTRNDLDPELTRLKLWARVGVILNNIIGGQGVDGVRILKAKVQYAKDSTDMLWIFEGRKGKIGVVAYARGKHIADALFRFDQRQALGKVKWKVDEGWQDGDRGSPAVEEGLPPAPAF